MSDRFLCATLALTAAALLLGLLAVVELPRLLDRLKVERRRRARAGWLR